jgi:DUF1680 family protein
MKNLFGCIFFFAISILHTYGRIAKQTIGELKEFELSDIRLTESPFRNALLLDKQWLFSLNPDRLLSGFRQEAGLAQKASKYGGWESRGVAGQTLGHYLSALAMMYASTDDEGALERIRYSVNELDVCQQAFDFHGLFAAFPNAKKLFQEIYRGNIRTEGFDLNGSWVPFYTMHKLCAGLIDVYHYTSDRQAYKVLSQLAEGLYVLFAQLSDAQIQKVLTCEHGGINESMAELYSLTGDRKFLELSLRLNHKAFVEPLAVSKDELKGKHANTQIPKVVGVIRQYELTGNKKLYDIADFFWHTVVHNHSYVIGGNSEAEHFGVPGRICDRITDKTCENCNTYNMLKLTKHLFCLKPDISKADYYERALYNQILASQNPEDGMVCYMSPLSAGSQRNYSTPFDSFWCCVGTGLENHVRYGEFIYHTDEKDNLYVNLFIPSVLDWKARGIRFEQKTAYPASDTVRYMVNSSSGKQKFTLNLRYPGWAEDNVSLFVNGQRQTVCAVPGEYIPITRKWKDGDRISIVIPKKVTSEAALGNDRLRAYLYGPIVLSADFEGKNYSHFPIVVTDDIENASLSLKPAGKPLEFILEAARPCSIKMKPYYQMGGKPLMVYFEHYTIEEWTARKDEIMMKQDREKWIKEQTVSSFQPGEMQPERDHGFKGEKARTGELNGRKFRKAVNGGWFSFEMEVRPDISQDLLVSYWGNLGDIYKFNVEIDGTSIATVIIHWWGNTFVDKLYHIPFELTENKKKITVSFKALDNRSVAGPIFNCKIIKR